MRKNCRRARGSTPKPGAAGGGEGWGGGGVEGVVVACSGNGNIHHALEAALLRGQDAGVRVLRCTRCPEGQVLVKPGDRLPVAPGGLSPVKARIGLMLDLL